MFKFHLMLALLGLMLTALTGRAQAYQTTIEDVCNSPSLSVVATDPTARAYTWELKSGQVALTTESLAIPSADGYVMETSGSTVLLTGEQDFDEGEVTCWILPIRDGATRVQGVIACASSDFDPGAAAPGAYVAATYLTAGGAYYVRLWVNCPAAGANAFPGIEAATVAIDDPGDTYHKLTLKVDRTGNALALELYWDDVLKTSFPANEWWNGQVGPGKVGVLNWFANPGDLARFDQFSSTWLNDPVPVELSGFEVQ